MDASKELQEVLKVLADQFGTTVSHVWEILVKQQMVDSITTIAMIVAMAIICILSIIVLVRAKKYSDEKNDYDSGSVIISGAIAIITGALLVLIVPFCLDNIVTGFVNPEYGALMDILEKLGGQ